MTTGMSHTNRMRTSQSASFELTAIKTVLPVSEGVTAGAVEGAGDSDSIIDGE